MIFSYFAKKIGEEEEPFAPYLRFLAGGPTAAIEEANHQGSCRLPTIMAFVDH
jgi:hypothetical protein